MGYSTQYNLSYELPEALEVSKDIEDFRNSCIASNIVMPHEIHLMVNAKAKLEDELINFLENTDASGYPWIEFLDGNQDDCKWYEHERDMKELSEKFPTILFTLKGEGEESGDIWIKYFKYGKMQICDAQIVFEPYNEAFLN